MTEVMAAHLNCKVLPPGIQLVREDCLGVGFAELLRSEPVSEVEEEEEDYSVDFGQRIPTSRQAQLLENKKREALRQAKQRMQHGAASTQGFQGTRNRPSANAEARGKKSVKTAKKQSDS